MARAAAARCSSALPRPVRLHRARPAAAPHGRSEPTSGGGCCTASTGSSSTPSAGARRWPSLASTRGHPPPRLPQRGDARRRRAHAAVARRHPAVQGAAGRDRSNAAGSHGARLLVAGDPAMPLDGLRSAERVEWRLGFLSQPELDRALSEATVAVFPYRAELDQSGALLQALGAGVPAVVYDVAGLGEPIRRYGAGTVVPAGDIDGLTEAVRQAARRSSGAGRGPGRRRGRAARADVGRVSGPAPGAVRELV